MARSTYRYKAPKKRKNYSWLFLLITLIVVGALFIPSLLSTEPEPVLVENIEEPETSAAESIPPPYDFSAVTFPEIGQSAVGTLGYGTIQTSSDNQVSAPMASITKLVTVLAILEKAPLNLGEQGDVITLTAQDEQYWRDYVAIEGTVTPVTAGYQMTQYEALQAILLPSSNNMADTLVDRYFANRDDYLSFANSLIASYGLNDTRVADASGFSPDSVSTPSELIIIGQKILQNPVLAEIVAQPNAEIAVAGTIPNYNPLIEVSGVTGIKPGATDEAGYCLIFSADTNNAAGNQETIIAVVMGQKDRATYVNGSLKLLEDTKTLINAQ